MRARKPTSIDPEASPETANGLPGPTLQIFPSLANMSWFLLLFCICICMYIQKCEVWRRSCTACAANGQKPLTWPAPGLAMHCLALFPSFPTSRCPILRDFAQFISILYVCLRARSVGRHMRRCPFWWQRAVYTRA